MKFTKKELEQNFESLLINFEVLSSVGDCLNFDYFFEICNSNHIIMTVDNVSFYVIDSVLFMNRNLFSQQFELSSLDYDNVKNHFTVMNNLIEKSPFKVNDTKAKFNAISKDVSDIIEYNDKLGISYNHKMKNKYIKNMP